MKNIYLLISFTLLIDINIINCFAQSSSNKEHIKEITETIKTKKGDTLIANVSFGQLTVDEWDKNEIDFYVKITGKGSTSEEAKKYVDSLYVTFNQKGNIITFNSQSKPSELFKSKIKIMYALKVPSNIFVYYNLLYGDIFLNNDIKNNIYANVNFGNFTANNLYGKKNAINLSYGNFKLKEAKNLKLSLNFTFDCRIDKINYLNLQSSNSYLNFKNIDSLNILSNFDKINIDSLAYIKGDIKQSNLNINSLQSDMNLKFNYGNLVIKNLAHDFKIINLTANHTPIYITLDESQSFNADISVNQGAIEAFDFLSDKKTQNDKLQQLKGSFGKQSTTSNIIIKNDYGVVKLNKL